MEGDIFHERDERYKERFALLEQLIDTRFNAAEKLVETSLAYIDKAVTKAEGAAEKRFESVNEFRGAMADQATRMLQRAEADAKFKSADDKINSVDAAVTKLELEVRGSNATATGKSVAMGNVGAYTLAILAILVSLAAAFISHGSPASDEAAMIARLDALSARINALTPSIQTKP